MKNLTRILALVLVFTMMVSSAAFAAKFTDVAEDSTYAEAVEVLSALGIINGYEDGTFKPDAVITRAEVVAIVNRLQGLTDAAKAAAGTSMYTDVATSDWFAGDVNLASQMGIVSGDGNGLFRPNDQVKYEEAVKMMVAALGYNHEYVMKQGGWPTGYLVIATDKGVTKGLSATAGTPAPRGVVAKLAYQSLTAPMMVLSTYDDDGKATYVPDAVKTLLGTKLGFAKVVGYVNTNEVSSLNSNNQADKGYINYTFDSSDTFDSTSSKNQIGYKNYVGNRDVADFTVTGADDEIGSMNKINVGETDVADTLGLATEIYIGLNDDDEAEVLTYIVSKKNNSFATIEKTADIQPDDGDPAVSTKYESQLTVADDALRGTLSVYDDEVDTTNTEYKLDNANIIYNGAWVDADLFSFPTMAKAELLDNDGDGKYEFVYVTEYKTYVVDSVFASNKKIGMKVGATIDLTNFIEEKEGYTYSIKLDGEEIAITDLKENDVLSVAADKYDGTAKVYDIIVSRNVVDGAVESIDPNTNAHKVVYAIAGAEYTIANNQDGYVPSITSSTEGKFFIDAFGKIAMTDVNNTISGNLAFIQGMGEYDSLGSTQYEIELLNKDGSVVIYTLADNVQVKENGTNKEISDAGVMADGSNKTVKDNVAAYIEALIFGGDDTEDKSAADFANRVVTYKANASGKITSITFAATGVAEGLSIAAGSAADEYDASVNALGNYGMKESTVIFYLPIAERKTKDDYKVASISMLVDEKTYDTAYLDIDEDINAGVVIITSDSISIADGSALAIVTGSVISTNEEGDKVITVTFLQNGETATLSVDAEAEVNNVDSNPFVRGAIFEYSVNAEGFIDDAEFCGTGADTFAPAAVYAKSIDFGYQAEDSDGNPVFDEDGNPVMVDNRFATKKTGNADFTYIAGYVVAKNGSTITLSNDYTAESGDRVAIPSTANVYVMNANKSKVVPQVAAIGDITKVAYKNGVLDEEEDTYVIIKYVDKEIVDVVAYKGLNDKYAVAE